MDKGEREQIQLILDHEFGLALRRSNKIMNEVCARHSASSALQSGATIREVLRLVCEDLDGRLDSLLVSVGNVSREKKAVQLLQVAFEEHMDKLLHGDIRKTATVSSGRGMREPLPSAWDETQRLFNEARADLDTKLRIASYDFSGQPSNNVQPVTATTQIPLNRGGKPLAAHWDAMWAEIAVQLWTGKLNPKKQADIKRAMFDWLNTAGINAGDTAVTARARALWQCMERAE